MSTASARSPASSRKRSSGGKILAILKVFVVRWRHYRASRALAGLSDYMLKDMGISRGEITNPEIIKHPQLMIAPALVAVIWHGLFGKLAPLDLDAMFKVHIDLIFGPGRAP